MDRHRVTHEKERKAANIHYRRAILQAIEQLHDFQSRSNVDAIRKHAMQASEESNRQWNETVFLKALKAVVEDGEIEKFTNLNCALSPEYKRKRADSLSAIKEKQIGCVTPLLSPLPPPIISLDHNNHAGYNNHIHSSSKLSPKRKPEHDKWKIIPKSIHDRTIIINPMDTH